MLYWQRCRVVSLNGGSFLCLVTLNIQASFLSHAKEILVMIKRCFALLFSIVLCLSLTVPAMADLPKPITVIPWDELPPVVEGQHHYLLLCVDQWNGNPKNLGNTDGMVLVTFDTRTKRLMLTSFSREMLIQRPDASSAG